METIAIIAVFLAICALFTSLRNKSAAERIVRDLKRAYTADHEFRVVDAAALFREFGHLDLDYYLDVTRELEERGFTYLADLQDVTTSAVYPPGCFYRVMLNSDGTIRAFFFHMVIAVGIVRRGTKTISMLTEFSDGVFVSTRQASPTDAATRPATILTESLDQNASAAALDARHEERVGDYLSKHPGAHPLVIRSVEESIESAQREMVELARHRESIGWVTRAELGRIVRGRGILAFLLRKAVVKELAKG